MTEVARVTVTVFGVWLAAMVITIAAVKQMRTIIVRRRAAAVDEVRPVVLASLDTGRLPEGILGRRRRAAEEVATALLPKLRGEDRAALARVLDESGMLRRATHDLGSRSPVRRMRAAEMIGNAGHEAALPRLADLLCDRDGDVRASAARALGKIGHPAGVRGLLVALGERRVPVNTVSMALLRIGAGAGGEIALGLDADDALVRSTAAELVGSLGIVSARHRLEELLLDREHRVQAAAARALGRIGVPNGAVPLVVLLDALLAQPGLSSDEHTVAVAAVEALGRIGNRLAIPSLESSLMRTRALSYAASEALSEMGVRRSASSQRERVRGTIGASAA